MCYRLNSQDSDEYIGDCFYSTKTTPRLLPLSPTNLFFLFQNATSTKDRVSIGTYFCRAFFEWLFLAEFQKANSTRNVLLVHLYRFLKNGCIYLHVIRIYQVIEYLDSSSFASMFAKKQDETNGDAAPDNHHLYTEGVTTQVVQEGGEGGGGKKRRRKKGKSAARELMSLSVALCVQVN